MKKNFVKKLLATVLTASLAAGALTACGSGSPDRAASSSDSSAAGDTAAAADDTSASDNAASESTESTDASEDSATEVRTIKAVTGGGPRPYVYVDENDQPTGYDIEVLRAVLFDALPQYDLEIEVADFSAVFAGLNAGTYQIGVNNFSYNEERAANYLYSLPYDKINYVFVYNKDAEPITSLADAAGKTFENGAGVSVTNAVEAWNKLNPGNEIIINYTDVDTAVRLQRVEDGAVDFDIIDGPMYIAYVAEYGFDVGKFDIPEEETKLIAENLYAYYLLPKDEGQLRDDIDGAIKQLKEDGTLKKISEQFFDGEDHSPETEVLSKGSTN